MSIQDVSLHERALLNLQQEELPHLMQALRLQNPYPLDSPEHLLWNDQSQLNIPLLIQASLYLDTFCKLYNKKRILFSSRDCCLWIKLFKTLYPQYESIYFHASRHTYALPSKSYLEYVQSLYTQDSLIVDVHSSGNSCKDFFKKHFGKDPTFLAAIKRSKTQHGIIRTKVISVTIEQINYDIVGALYDVQDGIPLRSPPEYDLRYVYPSHLCIKKCTELLSQFNISKFNKRILEWAFEMCNRGIEISKYITHAVRHHHYIDRELGLRHIHQTDETDFFAISEQGVKTCYRWSNEISYLIKNLEAVANQNSVD